MLFSSGFSQPKDQYFAWNIEGTGLYEKKSLESSVLLSIPYGERVTITEESEDVYELMIPMIRAKGHFLKGRWVKIEYKGTIGYGFDGYLLKKAPLLKARSGKYITRKEDRPVTERVDEHEEDVTIDGTQYKKRVKNTYYTNGGYWKRSWLLGCVEDVHYTPNSSFNELYNYLRAIHEIIPGVVGALRIERVVDNKYHFGEYLGTDDVYIEIRKDGKVVHGSIGCS